MKNCAYFCITSDQDSTFDFLSSMFMSFVFIKLVRYADKHGVGGKLPVPVQILADELANIGVIPDLTKKISTIRSRSLFLACIFQESSANAKPVSIKSVAGNYRKLRYTAIFRLYG
mgnify:CR=1 FL=1